MTIIGNILLVLAAIIFISLTSVINNNTPGGDAAVGYAWTIILLNFIFLICMIAVTAIVGSKGGYDWVYKPGTGRFFIVTTVLLAALIATGIGSLFKYEQGPVPGMLRKLSLFIPFVIPLLLIALNFILLNKGIRFAISPQLYTIPAIVLSVLAAITVLSGIYAFMVESGRNRRAIINGRVESENSNHNRMLAEIDSCDVMINMVFILVFTDANQSTDVREKAVLKVKTHPQWQQELVKRLQSDWAPEAFNFLASNDVNEPALFPTAINEGIRRQAKLIRESIRSSSHPSNFYPGQFSWEVERVLRTVDRFKSPEIDFLPAVKELRAALDEPSAFSKPSFACAAKLDSWIKDKSFKN